VIAVSSVRGQQQRYRVRPSRGLTSSGAEGMRRGDSVQAYNLDSEKVELINDRAPPQKCHTRPREIRPDLPGVRLPSEQLNPGMYTLLLSIQASIMQVERSYSERSSPEDDDKSGIRKTANRMSSRKIKLINRSMCKSQDL
jgi:hypothetical protein